MKNNNFIFDEIGELFPAFVEVGVFFYLNSFDERNQIPVFFHCIIESGRGAFQRVRFFRIEFADEVREVKLQTIEL